MNHPCTFATSRLCKHFAVNGIVKSLLTGYMYLSFAMGLAAVEQQGDAQQAELLAQAWADYHAAVATINDDDEVLANRLRALAIKAYLREDISAAYAEIIPMMDPLIQAGRESVDWTDEDYEAADPDHPALVYEFIAYDLIDVSAAVGDTARLAKAIDAYGNGTIAEMWGFAAQSAVYAGQALDGTYLEPFTEEMVHGRQALIEVGELEAAQAATDEWEGIDHPYAYFSIEYPLQQMARALIDSGNIPAAVALVNNTGHDDTELFTYALVEIASYILWYDPTHKQALVWLQRAQDQFADINDPDELWEVIGAISSMGAAATFANQVALAESATATCASFSDDMSASRWLFADICRYKRRAGDHAGALEAFQRGWSQLVVELIGDPESADWLAWDIAEMTRALGEVPIPQSAVVSISNYPHLVAAAYWGKLRYFAIGEVP